MKIGKEIALEAKKNNLCQAWFKEMMTITNYSKLAEMYFKGDDWAMEKDFPNLSLLRAHKGGIEPYGLITDSTSKLANVLNLAVFGKSKVELEYSGYSVCKLIIRHDSEAIVIAKDNAILYINILDNAFVKIECTDNAKVVVFDYGKNTQVESKGNVEVKSSKFK